MKFKCAYTELVAIDKLILIQNPKNNNVHSKSQIDRLAKIIKFAGQRSPIVVSKRSGFITKGHGRLMALAQLGWKKAAVDYQDYATEAEEYQDMTADNEIARWAHLDIPKMKLEMKTLDLGDLDLLGLQDADSLFNTETKEDDEKGDGGGSDDENEFIILVTCEDEQHQQEVFEKLSAEKLQCKII